MWDIDDGHEQYIERANIKLFKVLFISVFGRLCVSTVSKAHNNGSQVGVHNS